MGMELGQELEQVRQELIERCHLEDEKCWGLGGSDFNSSVMLDLSGCCIFFRHLLGKTLTTYQTSAMVSRSMIQT